MPTPHAVLSGLNWPNPDHLGVTQWSVTDETTFDSTVATVHRTPEAIRARVFSQDLEGHTKALFSAVWDVKGEEAVLKNHDIHGQPQPLATEQAAHTFNGYVTTMAQAPRFTYTGDAPEAVAAVEQAATPVKPMTTIPSIPRRIF